jgi:hypothetical protein
MRIRTKRTPLLEAAPPDDPFDDDTDDVLGPRDPGGAVDDDVITAADYTDRLERDRAARAREIRRLLEQPADDLPDRMPEGVSMEYVDGVRTFRPTGRRGRKPGCTNLSTRERQAP